MTHLFRSPEAQIDTASQDIAVLYHTYPEIYRAIAHDRDFGAQVRFVLESLQTTLDHRPIVADLFAGPAYHAAYVESTGSATSLCIDTSDTMRAMACATGGIPAAHYICGRLPGVLRYLPSELTIDAALLLRYSVGYLDRLTARELLVQLRRFMPIGSKIFIELHRDEIVANEFSNLPIRKRCVIDPDLGEITCTWPSAVRMSASELDSPVIEMEVVIETNGPQNRRQTLRFLSREHFHSADDMRTLALQVGGYASEVSDCDAFPCSNILQLTRK